MDVDRVLDYYLGPTRRKAPAPVQRRRQQYPSRRTGDTATDAVVTLAKTTMILGFTAGMAGMLANAGRN